MYTQTSAIAISSILFVFMLIGFVTQSAGMNTNREFFVFENVSICWILVEIFRVKSEITWKMWFKICLMLLIPQKF
jgi:hypothetical protein